MFNPAAKGYLLITWKPEEVSGDVLASLDAVLALGSPCPGNAFVDLTAAVAGMPRADIARRLDGPPGRSGVEPVHQFHFRTEPGTPTGAVADNLIELEAELAGCDVVEQVCLALIAALQDRRSR
jgi:hypothetical protein